MDKLIARGRLRDRRMTFSSVTGITHGLLDTFITPEGVKRNSHSSFVHSQLTAKDGSVEI